MRPITTMGTATTAMGMATATAATTKTTATTGHRRCWRAPARFVTAAELATVARACFTAAALALTARRAATLWRRARRASAAMRVSGTTTTATMAVGCARPTSARRRRCAEGGGGGGGARRCAAPHCHASWGFCRCVLSRWTEGRPGVNVVDQREKSHTLRPSPPAAMISDVHRKAVDARRGTPRPVGPVGGGPPVGGGGRPPKRGGAPRRGRRAPPWSTRVPECDHPAVRGGTDCPRTKTRRRRAGGGGTAPARRPRFCWSKRGARCPARHSAASRGCRQRPGAAAGLPGVSGGQRGGPEPVTAGKGIWWG